MAVEQKGWCIELKILVVYNVVEFLDNKGNPDDIFSEQEAEYTEQAIEEALRSHGHETVAVPIRQELWEPLSRFDPREWLIFNLCESIRDKTYLEPYVISIYEYLGFRHTGSSRTALSTCLNKAHTKEILRAHGITTAPFQVLAPGNTHRELEFPLFVKPVAEDASLGITRSSVVHNDRELRTQLKFIWERYRQPALVEKFLLGREFNVTILGNETPRVLPLSEIDFSRIENPEARIVTYAGKWVPHTEDYQFTEAIVPARVDEELRLKISHVALNAYKIMGLRDYGRVDLRVMDGQPYVLEVNPNADLAPGAGISNAARAAGMSYADLADEIVRLAANRYRLNAARPRLFSIRSKPFDVTGQPVHTVPVNAFALKQKRALPKVAVAA